jgi:hypothetical protein
MIYGGPFIALLFQLFAYIVQTIVIVDFCRQRLTFNQLFVVLIVRDELDGHFFRCPKSSREAGLDE